MFLDAAASFVVSCYRKEAVMLDRYQDMLDLPRPPSPSHAPMRRRDRAAQFAPFAALTGFDEQIRKVAWMQRSAFPYEGKARQSRDG